MMKQSKVWLALLGATVALGALVGTASARNLSISNQSIRATWAAMEFSNPSAGVLVRCPVTLEGSLHSRTIAKVVNSLIGYITRAAVAEGSCVGGRARVRTETLPWHVTYQGFSGTLPNILTIRTTVARPAFDVTATFFGFPITCTFRTSNVNGIFNREAGGALTNVQVEGRELAGEGGFGCERGNLAGTSTSLTLLGAATRLTVTLI
ncbi:MAG TPA: hypothetical protein VKB03_16305 [Conexibacter sp.]|nr:hypothetical protein [Conexibacter sp.]